VDPVVADAVRFLEAAAPELLARVIPVELEAIRTQRGRAAVVEALAALAERLPQISRAVSEESALVPASAAPRPITGAAAEALRIPAL
jgi:hypothetical protein